MSNIEVHAIRGQVVLVTDTERTFHAHSTHEAHDLVTRILQAIDNANGQREVEQEVTVILETCPRCNRRKGPKHRCVGMKASK